MQGQSSETYSLTSCIAILFRVVRFLIEALWFTCSLSRCISKGGASGGCGEGGAGEWWLRKRGKIAQEVHPTPHTYSPTTTHPRAPPHPQPPAALTLA